jgi:hypothetical protein
MHSKLLDWEFVILIITNFLEGGAHNAAAFEQVLKRELPADKYEVKRKKLEGKRAKDYIKVPYFIAICMKRQV